MIATLKKIILKIFSLPNKGYNWTVLKYKKVSYLNYPIISGKIFIAGSGNIIFGKNVRINSSLSSNPIGGDTRTLICVAKDAEVRIGSYSGLSNTAIFCKKHIIIGKYVKIGGGVKIYDSDFHALNFAERKTIQTDIPKMDTVELMDGCFIGAHSIILKGVVIGKESIIGAGSVVTKSVPDGEIWGGNPIRFIRKL